MTPSLPTPSRPACSGLTPSGLTPSGLTPSALTPSALTPSALTPVKRIFAETHLLPCAGCQTTFGGRRSVSRYLFALLCGVLASTSIATAQTPTLSPVPQEYASPPLSDVQPVTAASRATATASASASDSRSVIVVTDHDPEPPPFSSSPLSRSAAVAADTTLNDVCSVGPLCWAVGERGVIVRSDDSGATWSTAMLPFECSLQSVCFLTNTIGWAAGTQIESTTSTGGNSRAVLLQTRDGGRTWLSIDSDQPNARSGDSAGVSTFGVGISEIPGFLKVAWFGLEEAVAVTLPVSRLGNATLLRTEDGGRRWSAIRSDIADARFTMGSFVSTTEGIAGGERQAYATIVGENSITTGRPMPTRKQIRTAQLSPDGTAWMAGDAAFLLTSDNFGVTWRSVDTAIMTRPEQLLDFHAVASRDSIVLLGGSPGSVVLKSENGGRHWVAIPSGAVGEIRRLLFVDDQCVLATGTLGTILRSTDAGSTWSRVRSGEHRAGILNLVTELHGAPWELMAANSADSGIRTVSAQISPRLREDALFDRKAVSATDDLLRSRQRHTQTGANELVTEWSFSRNRPDHHLSGDQLISEWNRQTDGELRRLLPLRLARLIRIWRPTVLVVESSFEQDAVAEILRQALPEAIRQAAADSSDSGRVLEQLFLQPWTVQRVVARCPSDRTTALAYRHSDLLESCGTTIGLMTMKARDPFRTASGTLTDHTTVGRVCYETVDGNPSAVTPPSLFHSLQRHLDASSQRDVLHRSRSDVERLLQTAKAAEIQNAAIYGHLQLSTTEDTLIAQLQQLGNQLPPSLALQQLRQMAELNLRSMNIDGYLSVLKEIIRRFPQSPESRDAAETLYLYYSSAEVRRYRFGEMMQRAAERDKLRRVSPLGIVDTGASGPAAFPGTGGGQLNPVTGNGLTEPDSVGDSPTGFRVSPKIERASGVTFGDSAADQASTLLLQWDQQAGTALQILQAVDNSLISEQVILRHAANARRAGRTGEQSRLLSEITGRGGLHSIFAAAESQTVNGAVGGPLPVVNIQKSARRPWLDAVLNDTCWEVADEIFLTTDTRVSTFTDAKSLVMMSWDDQFLYVAARLENLRNGPDGEPIALNRAHDAVHGNRDRLELTLDVDRDYSTAFQFTVDRTGQTSERCFLLENWNPEWYVAADTDEQGWRLELAIPLRELDLNQTQAGDLWAVRITRTIPGHLRQTLPAGSNDFVSPTAGAAGSGGGPEEGFGTQVSDAAGYGMIRFIRNQKR